MLQKKETQKKMKTKEEERRKREEEVNICVSGSEEYSMSREKTLRGEVRCEAMNTLDEEDAQRRTRGLVGEPRARLLPLALCAPLVAIAHAVHLATLATLAAWFAPAAADVAMSAQRGVHLQQCLLVVSGQCRHHLRLERRLLVGKLVEVVEGIVATIVIAIGVGHGHQLRQHSRHHVLHGTQQLLLLLLLLQQQPLLLVGGARWTTTTTWNGGNVARGDCCSR